MSGLDSMTLRDAIFGLRATRIFRDEPIPEPVLHEVLEAATMACSSGNTQPWEFIVVRDEETKRAIQKEMNLAYLFIAHDLSMVRYVSDRMAVMYLGALAEVGPANDVFFEPQHPYTQFLIESNPEPDPKMERESAHKPIFGEITSPVNVKPGCRFADRCPQVMDRCRNETPHLIATSENRQVACHLFT